MIAHTPICRENFSPSVDKSGLAGSLVYFYKVNNNTYKAPMSCCDQLPETIVTESHIGFKY